MFQQACSTIRNALYGIRCDTRIGNRLTVTNGTAFMIAQGIIVTAAHALHLDSNSTNPRHNVIKAIRAPDVGQTTETVEFIAEDTIRDLALLQIDNPRSNEKITLEQNVLPIGTSCGSLGFPLATVDESGFHLVLRFQGAHISAFFTKTDSSGRSLPFYETDALMYKGSSGCPGFIVNGNVFGLHNKSRVELPEGSRPRQTERYAISLWVPSTDIITFARDNGVIL
jgi:S1-C subfamily serine protease